MRRAARMSLEELAPWLWTPTPYPTDPNEPIPVIDWQEMFGNDHPIEIEVGFGKGMFLVEATGANPDVNYFGIEIDKKYTYYTATRLAKRNRSNVKVTAADAKALLQNEIADESVQAIHVYFPDPWWKKRHAKRRLFTSDFVNQCQRILKEHGILHIATDVGDYFAVMKELLTEIKSLRELPPPEEHAPKHDMDYLTNFERKARQQGKPIYRARYERISS